MWMYSLLVEQWKRELRFNLKKNIMMDKIKIAREKIAQADAILITAGAGMGVDSGLPDFRGNEGFWKAYPIIYGKSSMV